MKKRMTSLFITMLMLLSCIPTLPTQAVTVESPPMKIGDYVQMGKYYDDPILWRCVNIDENGPLMLADQIITVKPFDAAGDHKYLDGTPQAESIYRTYCGSNLWETSNLRSWLNSSEAANNVNWPDGCPPIATQLSNKSNAYADEKGFLAEGNFTASEQTAIKSVKQKSLLNALDLGLRLNGTSLYKYNSEIANVVQNYDTAYFHMVTDKMFILDTKQLNAVYLNSPILGNGYWIGEPTEKAMANSDNEMWPGFRWYSWTRTPCSASNIPDDLRCISSTGYIYDDSANATELGVRPAFYTDLSSQIFKSGNGSIETPYSMNEKPQELPPIKIGDYIKMGKYYDESILWRCVSIDENGPLMLADQIITVKPFDAAGDHKYLDGTPQAESIYRTYCGSNLWETSNLRSWLNSSETANNVNWLDGCPPIAAQLFSTSNAYADEKGFLAEGNFTASEQTAIKSVKQKSLLNALDLSLRLNGTSLYKYNSEIANIVQNYDTAYFHMVTDKMFILDTKQLNAVYLNGTILGSDYWIGKPTEKAIANSDNRMIPGLSWYSWTRTPCTSSSIPDDVRCVGSTGYVYDVSAYANELGVRPAFYMDISSELRKSGNGSLETPYTMDGTSVVENDINNDGVVDIKDLDLLSKEINTKSTDVNWNKTYDINADNTIDIYDLVKVSKSLGTN